MPFPTYERFMPVAERNKQRHRDVQLRAYYLWESAGRPLGMRSAEESWQDHFWKRAERAVSNAENWGAALVCASSPC